MVKDKMTKKSTPKPAKKPMTPAETKEANRAMNAGSKFDYQDKLKYKKGGKVKMTDKKGKCC